MQALEIDALKHLRSASGGFQPNVGIVLGSGLGGVASEIVNATSIPYTEIPGFVSSTAAGHAGKLIFGWLRDRPIVAMSGRFHRYEGWSHDQVIFPVQVLAALGAQILIVSNAAGGLRHHFRVGDIMVIRDHINFLPMRSTVQCMRFRSNGPYDSMLAAEALAAGRQDDIPMHQGTYLSTLGPAYETRAEYRMMRRLGADCVGMSTVPEVLEAASKGMRVLALSLISNVARPDAATMTTHQEVVEAGHLAQPRMLAIVSRVIERCCS